MDKLDIGVYKPNEAFWTLWEEKKYSMKQRGYHVIIVGGVYLVLHIPYNELILELRRQARNYRRRLIKKFKSN